MVRLKTLISIALSVALTISLMGGVVPTLAEEPLEEILPEDQTPVVLEHNTPTQQPAPVNEPKNVEPAGNTTETKSGNDSTETKSGNDSSETKTGDDPTDTKTGDDPTDTEDGDDPTDTEDGDEPTDTEDGDEPTDTEDSDESTDTEDGDEPTDTEDGDGPTNAKPGDDPSNTVSDNDLPNSDTVEKTPDVSDIPAIIDPENDILTVFNTPSHFTPAASAVAFTHRGNRMGCPAIVAEALKYVGHHPRPNMFNSYSGMVDDWCAMFVNYVFENANSCPIHTAAQHRAVQIRSWSCTSIMDSARAQGRWEDGNFKNPAPGDWILFNWGSKPWNVAQHIGIVSGHDGERVYYVDGNTGGNRVLHQSRLLTDKCIRGYVIMFQNPLYPTHSAFDDVYTNHEYYSAIAWAYENGIISAESSLFDPDSAITGADFVLALWRLEGSPLPAVPGAVYSEADVSNLSWYRVNAISWAYENYLLDSMTGGFNPDVSISRQNMVQIMYNYFTGKGGVAITDVSVLSAYSDRTSVSYKSTDAMCWALAYRLINGSGGSIITGGRLLPGSTFTRAETMQLLYNYVNWYANYEVIFQTDDLADDIEYIDIDVPDENIVTGDDYTESFEFNDYPEDGYLPEDDYLFDDNDLLDDILLME